MRDLLAEVDRTLSLGQPCVWCAVVQTRGSTPQKAGAAMLVLPDGRQLGTWRHDLGRYFPFDGTAWGPACDPPLPPPARPAAKSEASLAAEENYGIDREKWSREPRRAAGARVPPDDARKARLTVIGGEAERRAVLSDLEAEPDLRGLRERVAVQAYPPDHWAVARCGFKTDGRPTIYLQAPDGRVLHRQDDYAGGAGRLAEAIRKADPSYDPRKDPDLTRPKAPDSSFDPARWPAWGWALGGAAALWLLRGVAARLKDLPKWLLERLADEVVKRLPPVKPNS